MAAKKNPLGLNTLQLKTLTILQQLARTPRHAAAPEEDGAVRLANFPPVHGDHYHVGDAVVLGRDMTGLYNPSVFVALERRGLVRSASLGTAVITPAGLAYDTGLADTILHRAEH